jgi:CheY-like chemotaxis protein
MPPDLHTILIVDDDPALLETLAELLRDDGHLVACAGDGAAALRYVEEHGPPQLIILDLMMPGMDGRSFRQALSARDDAAWVPVIVITGQGSPPPRRELDVVAVLSKPIEVDQLLDLVRRFAQ